MVYLRWQDSDLLVFFKRKAEKVWWNRAVWWGRGMDCHASLAMAVKFSFWVKRSGTKNIEYFILCPFRPCWNASLFKLRYYYVQEERFFWASLAVLTQESSLRREAEGKERKIKGNLHYLLLGLYLMEFELIKGFSDIGLCR